MLRPVHWRVGTVTRRRGSWGDAIEYAVRLPPGAECLARNDFEPHHAFRVGEARQRDQFAHAEGVIIRRIVIIEDGHGLN